MLGFALGRGLELWSMTYRVLEQIKNDMTETEYIVGWVYQLNGGQMIRPRRGWGC